MKAKVIVALFPAVFFLSCSGNQEKSPSFCEIPVIVNGPMPTYQAMANFNDSRYEYDGKALYVLPTGEGYKIIYLNGARADESRDVFEFVSKKLK